MSKQIKITVPDAIGDWLATQAAQSGQTPSALAALLVINQVNFMAQMEIEITPPQWGGKRVKPE